MRRILLFGIYEKMHIWTTKGRVIFAPGSHWKNTKFDKTNTYFLTPPYAQIEKQTNALLWSRPPAY